MTPHPAISDAPRLDNLPGILGRDLCILATRRSAALTEVRGITRWTGPGMRRSSWLLTFDDGVRLKGIRFAQVRHRRRAERLLRRLSLPSLPGLITSSGDAMLTEWIEGDVLRAGDVPLDVIRESGAVQAQLHTAALSRLPTPWAGISILRAIQRDIRALSAEGRLSPDEASALLRAADENRPVRVDFGIIHRDFAPDNLLIDDAGQIRIIDNETIRVGPIAFDLARVWYRWPMERNERTMFLRGYSLHRSAEGFLRHELFWLTAVLSESAVWHMRNATGGSEEPLTRLREIAAGMPPKSPNALSTGTRRG